MKRFELLCRTCLAAVAAILLLGSIDAQVTKGKSRPLTTKNLMRGLVSPHCNDIKKGLDPGPKDDKEWDSLALHASLLNEATYMLMEDDRCPDGTWADAASKTLRQGSADVLKAAEAKNLEDAKKAFQGMTAGCGACHKAHKKSK